MIFSLIILCCLLLPLIFGFMKPLRELTGLSRGRLFLPGFIGSLLTFVLGSYYLIGGMDGWAGEAPSLLWLLIIPAVVIIIGYAVGKTTPQRIWGACAGLFAPVTISLVTILTSLLFSSP